jgi:hypothetical protein
MSTPDDLRQRAEQAWRRAEAEYVTIAEAARLVRKALRAAFPQAKMSPRSRGDIEVEWDDTGPTVEEVTAALQGEPFIESDKAWNDTTYLRAHGYRLCFWCFNLAAREASQRDFERRQQEYAALQERQNEAVAEAHKAKRANRKAIEITRQEPETPAVHEAFERLREKAEAQVAAHEGDRRPSWAPPLILGEELTEVCQKLGCLRSDDKPIGRLWAHFATPNAPAAMCASTSVPYRFGACHAAGFNSLPEASANRHPRYCLKPSAARMVAGALVPISILANTRCPSGANGNGRN